MPRFPTEHYSKSLARQLRRTMTDEEHRLWWYLRDNGIKWRRQEPLGRFIVDFVCYEFRLIVEVDGSQHDDGPYDRARDAWLTKQGFTVLRFSNREVNREIDDVMGAIYLAIEGARQRLP